MKNVIALSLSAILCMGLMSVCHSAPPADQADTIYFGGDIVTINDKQPTAEAVAVKNGKLIAVGTLAVI